MATVNFSPIGNGFQFFTAAGLPLSGGFVYTYQAGTSTPLATYTTNAGTITNSNPMQLGADGRPPGELWLLSGSAYKFVITDSLFNPVGPTFDNITGINDLNNLTTTGNTTLGVNGSILNVSGGALVVQAGNTKVAGDLLVLGNTTLGDAAGDGLTINPNIVLWPGNPTHSGNHTWTGATTFNTVFTNNVFGASFGNTNRAGSTVLDWYDRSIAFTPVLQFGGASTGITYSTQTAKVTRIGNLLFTSVVITLTSKGSSTGSASIANVPYASVITSVGALNPLNAGAFATLANNLVAVHSIGSTSFALNTTNATGLNPLTDANFTNTSSFACTVISHVV